jgi:hypothetical protein
VLAPSIVSKAIDFVVSMTFLKKSAYTVGMNFELSKARYESRWFEGMLLECSHLIPKTVSLLLKIAL